MHTFKTDKTIIRYNSDMSGNVSITNQETGNEIKVPCYDLLDFVAAYIKERKINNLKDMETIEILGIPKNKNTSGDDSIYIKDLEICKNALLDELMEKNPFEYVSYDFRNYFDNYIIEADIDIDNKYIVNFYKILSQILLNARGPIFNYIPMRQINFYPIKIGDAMLFVNIVEHKVCSFNNVELSNDECIKIANDIINNMPKVFIDPNKASKDNESK